jgi:hypothetical protein
MTRDKDVWREEISLKDEAGNILRRNLNAQL